MTPLRTLLVCACVLLPTLLCERAIPLDAPFNMSRVFVDATMFGTAAITQASAADLAPNVHPRILFNQAGWDAIQDRYAASTLIPDTWAHHQREYTVSKGPNSSLVISLAALDTSAYQGATVDMSLWNEAQRDALGTLADTAGEMNEFHSGALFMCAFWAAVDARMAVADRFLAVDVVDTCKAATVAWAKVLLAHRAYNCAGACKKGAASDVAFIWETSRRFEVKNDWASAGAALGLSYDVLFAQLSMEERRTVRSALALLSMKKASWGNTVDSTRSSPNAKLHPHRIWSNWAPYHSNMLLANLAIEGESDFDTYTTSVLAAEGEEGYNAGMTDRFLTMLDAYMKHSIYPDGSTFEDGYTYFIALREGSLGLIAAQRRGNNLLDTKRFRGLIHNLAQMSEPWRCGQILGHASGGGLNYPAYAMLFRHVYPDGVLPAMLARHRFGDTWENNSPCRIDWHQNMMQMTILGTEHDAGLTTAVSPQELSAAQVDKLPKSFYPKRRGLVIMRNSWAENSAYVHFDARADAFFPGHDNADRGIFTFSARRQTWLADIVEWRSNVDSRKHSLMHVDGLAQDEKAPCVRLFHVDDDGQVAGLVIASADLTYAYNVQWARQWPDASPPTKNVMVYAADGTESKVKMLFSVKEEGDPRSFGWPAGDDGDDLGFNRQESNMWGDPDMGFMGMYTWKRDYRTTPVEYGVRSVVLMRSASTNGCVVVVDSFKVADTADHVFESYLIINDDVAVATPILPCSGGKCILALTSADGTSTGEVHILSPSGVALDYRVETFTTDTTHTRIVVRGTTSGEFNLWLGLTARATADTGTFSLGTLETDVVHVTHTSEEWFFTLDSGTHGVVATTDPRVKPEPEPELQPPARLWKLGPDKESRLASRKFTDDKTKFFTASDSEAQIALKLKLPELDGVSDGDVTEVISTCTARTAQKAVTQLSVYDCGGGRRATRIRYKARDCSKLTTDAGTSPCVGDDGVEYGQQLRFTGMTMVPGKIYVIVVSADKKEGVGSVTAAISHSRSVAAL